MKKSIIILQEGWDPTPDPRHSRPRWIGKDELFQRWGLGWRAQFGGVLAWNPRRSALPVPYEAVVILGPRFAWDYRLPDAAVAILEARRLHWGQEGMSKCWPKVFRDERMKGMAENQNRLIGGVHWFSNR